MTENKRRKILREIEVYSRRPVIEDDEITVADYAAEYGFSHQTAAVKLTRLVKDGVMTVRRGVYDPRTQKVGNAFRVIEKGNEA